MTKIPLALRLKRRAHRGVAEAQDLVVRELYKVFNEAVLHGGTAIWRCYGGARFSEDVDVYISRDLRRIDSLFEGFERAGLRITKRKVAENSLYSTLEAGGVTVRFEALFKSVGGSLRDYETADGNVLAVYSLSPEELIKEKTAAYLGRRKVRDLYDVFFLLKHVTERKTVYPALKRLVDEYEAPVDADELKVLVLEGAVPEPSKMLEYIRRWR